ncbi:MAG: Asp-tRNA(Asn)/Glu-tRNA(Gln) amidotransferase subunit GatC [Sulfobacillus acidophilus]|uniref:Aspartyl/glutamyl-tRNA(Asn/Gln) amidotransferase subunit C n=1 Tax=Sulfobacillus acidophilus TaxID=53633 RepID=A0A2T2WGA7_9FIRM|nr:MAG: Asp-tRNA(Asn)/Glu-tRNA(Gln) amidotransferase subunit GatC [Sulfobacillus acidophilus]
MELDDADILHVARLARLQLTAAEVEPVRRDLNRVLEYVQTLHQLNLDNIEPTMHVSGLRAILRNDSVQPSLTVEEALRNAPEVREAMFVVPRIMGEGGEDE